MKKIKSSKILNKISTFSKMHNMHNSNKNHFHPHQLSRKTAKFFLNKVRDLFFKTIN